ncbi:hypothetical protein V0288_10075 [Pannus brasiliensis CCIBt3594]|uniref:PEP-CTERM sorting domain-containing protein n=1 Tax=Pannus brasiliensis CCIBt3594 TaxID=1427578 RepID=A0AAW9QKI5_9CHRO
MKPVAIALAVTTALGTATSARALTIATIGANFTGTTRSQSGFIPPDTMGAAGPNHIVELINGTYAVYNKSGALQGSRVSLNQFWQSAGVTPAGSFAFDPRILYDPFSQRWFAAAVDNSGGNNNFLVGVSNSSNPLSGWKAFSIDSNTANTRWADFPALGINGDKVTIAANMFPITGQGATTATTTILTIDKNSLITTPVGQLSNLSRTLFQNNDPNNTGFAVQPVVDADNRAGEHFLWSDFNTPAGFFKRSSITGNAATATLNTTGGVNGGFLDLTAYNNPPLAQQLGGPNNVNTSDARFGSNVIYQLDAFGNNSFWGVQTVNNGGRAALRWFEIDANTNLLRQEGLIANANEDYYFGSIAVNNNRQVVIGFSCSSDTLFISSCAVTSQNLGGLTNSLTTFGARQILRQGTASYQVLDTSGRNRWGDYSATVLDPSDPTGSTFWTFQEIATGSTQWSVQITELQLSTPSVPEPGSVAGLVTIGSIAFALKRPGKK